jgi:CelD/BcsL family acetyltransferase involved in cellulose biosynthesis
MTREAPLAPDGVTVIDSLAALAAMRDEWDQLAARHRWLLLEYDWVHSCAATLHDERDLRIVTVRAGGVLIAAAPLVRHRARGVERLELAGLRVLYEPSGFLYRDEAALETLCDAVLALRRPLVLQRLDATSPVGGCLRRKMGLRCWVRHHVTAATVSVPLAGTWTDYVRSLSGKLRWQQKRARSLAIAQGPVSVERLAPGPAEVSALFDQFVQLEAGGWKGESRSALLTKERLGRFFRTYAEAAAARGALRVWFLRIGSTLAAAQLTVEATGCVWVLKIAYDERLAQMSPGFQLTFTAIEDAFARGFEAYEFLGGADDWKLRWRGSLRSRELVVSYPVSGSGLTALAVDLAVRVGRGMRRALPARPTVSS